MDFFRLMGLRTGLRYVEVLRVCLAVLLLGQGFLGDGNISD